MTLKQTTGRADDMFYLFDRDRNGPDWGPRLSICSAQDQGSVIFLHKTSKSGLRLPCLPLPDTMTIQDNDERNKYAK